MGKLRFWGKVGDALSALNAKTGEIGPVEIANVVEISYYIIFGPGTSAGGVQIESSPITGYTGIWAPEGSAVAWSAENKIHKVAISGASMISRARISTAIVGGTIDIYVVTNG